MPEVLTAPARVQLPLWRARLDLRHAGGGVTGAPIGRRGTPLEIFDADTGAAVRPFGPTDRPSAAVFHGFLFDRPRLAQTLGFGATVPADVDLLAAGFERWGDGVFREFEGRYAAAIWDAARGRLLLGHDALGREPMFYAIVDGVVWFSPNVLALAHQPEVPSRPNRLSFALGLLRYWPEAGETYFEAIRRVRPHHYTEITAAGGARDQQYWDPFPAEDEPWLPDDQVIEEFEPALYRAVARCMSLDPRGIMLSGGLDSVTIAGVASRYVREHGLAPITAVCGRTGHAMSNEEIAQPRVAEALGMPIDISTTDEWRAGRDDVSLSLEITDHLPSPSHIWWSGTYTAFYRRAASRGLNVLLTGSGGDNWLGVADRHAADLLARGKLLQLARFVKANTGSGYSLTQSARRLAWTDGLRPHLEAVLASIAPGRKASHHRASWLNELPPWFLPDPRERRDLVDRLIGKRTPALDAAGRWPRSHYRHYFRSMTNPFLHHENETAFHVDSWTGLVLLSPYHDRTLVSFFNRISPRLLLQGTRYKGLLRPVATKYVPHVGFDRQRKEYAPEDRLRDIQELRNGITSAWARVGPRLRGLERLGIVDGARLDEMFAGVPTQGLAPLGRDFAIMSHERWLQVHTGE